MLFNGNDLALLAVVPVVLAALTWFLLKTEAGIAVRGMADNMDRARLLGIPVNRLSMLLWSIAGGLAALTVTMRVPNEGIALDVTAGPTVLLPALAAAVVTGMTSLSGAFVAGVAIGVLDQLVRWNVERQATTYLVLLAVIVIGLLVQRSFGAKARGGSEESSWSVVGTGHPLPPVLARLPEVRLLQVRPAPPSLAVAVVLCRSWARRRRSTTSRSPSCTAWWRCRWSCSPAGAAS